MAKRVPPRQKAQVALEQVITVIVVVTALLTMNVYLKRSIQGRLRSSTDEIGEQFTTEARATTSIKSYSHTREEIRGMEGRKSELGDSYYNKNEATSHFGNLEAGFWER